MKRVIFVLFLALFIFFGYHYCYHHYHCLKIIGWCGDGIKQSNEECDNGSKNGGAYTPCGDDCRFVATPWFDSGTGLMWSAKSDDRMNWEDAKSYCDNLSEGLWADWRLPTISELRTLIVNCFATATMTGGRCGVTDSCLEESCWSGSCRGCDIEWNNLGKYSLFGDTSWFWSSSPVVGLPGYAWDIGFHYGDVRVNDMNDRYGGVRCVR